MIARSYLYVPANNLEMLEKAANRGSDALIIDFEDSVAVEDKEQARINLNTWLDGVDSPPQIWVRVNSESLDEDLASINSENIFGLVVPKATTSNLSYVSDVTKGRYQLSALIESAASILNAKEIASVDGVSFLQIGQLDLRAELGLSDDDNLETFKYALSHLVLASAAAGINQPIAPIYRDYKDEKGLRESCREFRSNGFFGRTCIHPKQVEAINDEFTPSEEALANAKETLEAIKNSQGAAVDSKGRMIDLASAKIAQRVIDSAKNL